ncbi:MAG: GTP-binding protein [Desulfobacterales bacterium]
MNTSFDLQKNRKVEIVLLSGFLGSGKTTLLKRILSWETDRAGTVVIVNEFGKVGIDGALLKETGSDVVELTSGCICCTLQVDLKQTLMRVRERFNPRQILIEASGVADPTTIAAVLHDPDLHEHLKLKKIITVLDSECWKAREAFGTVFYNQLKVADLILLNKIDLLDRNEIRRSLKEIHDTVSHCRVVPTLHCRVDSETIWADSCRQDSELELADFTNINLLDLRSQEGSHHRHENRPKKSHPHAEQIADADNYTAFSFQESRAIDENCFNRFIQDLPWEMFRLKGPVRFQDRTVLINFVGGRCDWERWSGTPETRLTFIGWSVNSEETLKRLKNCIIGT